MADSVEKAEQELISSYNYDEFVQAKFERWMNFEASPPLGHSAPDFPLWQLEDRKEVRLSSILTCHAYTVVEFGSFT
jgi:hypothetical protein